MKLHLKSIVPTGQDIALSSVFALCVVLAGNIYQGVNYYIFRPENHPAPQTTHELLIAVMGRVDTYQPTRSVVTFLFWAIVGIACMALYQGLAHTLRRIAHLHRLSTKCHDQPRALTMFAFWKQWLLTTLGSFMALTTAMFIFAFFCLCIVPVGIVYTRVFMFTPTPFNLVYALMGVSLTFMGLVLSFVGIRLIASRRRLLRLA